MRVRTLTCPTHSPYTMLLNRVCLRCRFGPIGPTAMCGKRPGTLAAIDEGHVMSGAMVVPASGGKYMQIGILRCVRESGDSTVSARCH